MKILLLCNKSPWPPKDGGAAATLCMIMGLSECQVPITVLAFNTLKHFTDTADIPEEYINKVEFHFVNIDTRINPVRLILNLIFSDKPYSIERFESAEFEEKLSGLLKNDFDIIQIEGLALCHYLPLIRQKTTAKVVFRPHNIESRIWSQLADEEKNPFRKSYFRILSKRIKRTETEIINDFDGVAAIAANDLSWFKSNGLSKPSIVVLPGVVTQNLRGNVEIKSTSVFFIGALDWLPNINGLRWFVKKVWPLVLKVIPGASFSIAGRNASGNIIRLLKGDNIFFHGEVLSSTEFMNDKSVMIVPLFSGSGIRMRIIEGMSLGKSIVTTYRGAEGIDDENKRNIFIADSPEDFSDCIIELLKNTDLLKQTGKNAIENVRKNYNILASTKNLLKFYSELIA
jgi:glycosyltransferase involved in cell wall biosynthesis